LKKNQKLLLMLSRFSVPCHRGAGGIDKSFLVFQKEDPLFLGAASLMVPGAASLLIEAAKPL
jgi:hypothetical protein